VLELLLENGFSASILTKSDLVLRDIDLLQSMESAAVSVSVAFTDEKIRELFEAKTKKTAARISALQELKAADIKTAALICPVIPYITDVKPLIDFLAGSVEKIWIYGLSMLNRNVQNWRNIETIWERHFPDLKEPVKAAVFSKEHAYWQTLRQDLINIQRERKLNLSIHV
jgi:DNA repair photolyase